MRTKLIHFLGGFTEEDIQNRISKIQEEADLKVKTITEKTEDKIKLITSVAEDKINLAARNALVVYERGKMLGQYRAAAYFISYAKSLYGRKDWSSKMFSQMTKFLNAIEANTELKDATELENKKEF